MDDRSFLLETHSDFKMPPDLGGDIKSTGFLGYDGDKNVYTSTEFTSQGRREVAQGSLNGDTWTWTSSEKYDGQEIQQKATNKILSPDNYKCQARGLAGRNQLDGNDGSENDQKK